MVENIDDALHRVCDIVSYFLMVGSVKYENDGNYDHSYEAPLSRVIHSSCATTRL